MSRIAARFASLQAQGRKALIPYVMAGDPAPAVTVPLLHAMVEAGADLLELGLPFSDPMADGPAIQQANLRSLGAGTTTADIFRIAADFRTRHPQVPLVLMGYANPMTIRGSEWFAAECAKAGVDGVICVDIPPEEDPELGPALRKAGVSLIRLATPTTDSKRLPAVLEGSSGFLYYVSVAGITGLQQAAQASIEDAVAQARLGDGTEAGNGAGRCEGARLLGRHLRAVDQAPAVIDVFLREQPFHGPFAIGRLHFLDLGHLFGKVHVHRPGQGRDRPQAGGQQERRGQKDVAPGRNHG